MKPINCPDNVILTREKHSDIISTAYVLTDDLAFSSPSGAACFVTGASINGYAEWHTIDGIQLKDIH